MADSHPLIALIHATPASAGPAHQAFAAEFSEARLWNLLDDRLISEAEAAGGLTAALRLRMQTLIGYALSGHADAILLTCSMYGPVAYELAATAPVPLLASDQALFDEVGRRGVARVAVLGPVRTGVDDTVQRLRSHLGAAAPAISGSVVEGARAATTADDPAALDKAVTEAALGAQDDADLIVLGQFSISPAQPAAQRATGIPVLSPPHLAAQTLREHFGAAR
ncbi:aspartate/glutamate racemase family protein [Actinoplanes sp. NPDC026670]|uniref:aspartate/glutamate racemase family protein n=1 Tax=Actinoplanes sp. NPDC026670 TaxID=3154700 RepID=UPI0033E584F9